MNFTIIGAGKMGRAIATRLLSGGSQVMIMDRDFPDAEKLAAELEPVAKGGATVKAVKMESPLSTDAVVLAVYYPSVPEILEHFGHQLDQKIIVDITNPLNAASDDLATPPGISAAEEIASKLPPGAKVIKAFNTTFASTLLAGQVAGQSLDVLIAGDDEESKNKLAVALAAGGLRPVDVGPLKRARQLEGLGLLHITLQQKMGTNWGSTVKILA